MTLLSSSSTSHFNIDWWVLGAFASRYRHSLDDRFPSAEGDIPPHFFICLSSRAPVHIHHPVRTRCELLFSNFVSRGKLCCQKSSNFIIALNICLMLWRTEMGFLGVKTPPRFIICLKDLRWVIAQESRKLDSVRKPCNTSSVCLNIKTKNMLLSGVDKNT